MSTSLPTLLLTSVIALPSFATVMLAVPRWFGVRFDEGPINRIVALCFGGASLACVALFVLMSQQAVTLVQADLGALFEVGGYAFRWELIGDRLSLPFAAFASMLVGVVGAFSRRYLHREPGYLRFYMLLSLFGAGVNLMVIGASLELVFFGWELVGLTSALLIAFFLDRRLPVAHALRTFVTYRMCDVGLLTAHVWLHHTTGGSAMELTAGSAPWATLAVPASASATTFIGLMLLLAAMGKGAQVPFGGWLPRAMEGPTPSSAIFYGAISIHLGPYLLLRGAHILEASPTATYAVITVGLLTALHGTFVGRAQNDIKSALAYASMTQVGLILAEIGFGLHYFALAHIVGHAALRSLQILRSPSLLADYQQLERAVGDQLPRPGGHLERLVPKPMQPWLYRHALERGYFDAIVRDYIVRGFVRSMLAVEAIDMAWVRLLSGGDEHSASENGSIAPEKAR